MDWPGSAGGDCVSGTGIVRAGPEVCGDDLTNDSLKRRHLMVKALVPLFGQSALIWSSTLQDYFELVSLVPWRAVRVDSSQIHN